MPSTAIPEVRVASAVSYRATRRRASSRSAARIERPASSSSSTGRSAIRRAGMSAATSTLRRRTMPRSITLAAGGGVEAEVGRSQPRLLERRPSARPSGFFSSIQPRNCQMALKSSMSLISGVPVSAISSGRAVAGPDPVGELQDVLGALGRLVLDEVRLVDDHAAEAEVAEPPDVTVEHLVVDDDDVGEPVDRVAVAVDDRGGRVGVQRPASRAQFVLTTFGTTTSSGYASAACAASSAWAVLPSPGSSASRKVRWPDAAAETTRAWCGISSRPPGARSEAGSGRSMQRGAAPPYSNDLNSGPSSSQLSRWRGGGPALAGGGEVGRQEGVGELPGEDRLRHDPALGRAGGRRRLGRRGLLRGRLDTGGPQHAPA